MVVGVVLSAQRRNLRIVGVSRERMRACVRGMHELAVLGADLVSNQRVVQGRPQLSANQLQQEEAGEKPQPR